MAPLHAGEVQEAVVFEVSGVDFAAVDAFVARIGGGAAQCDDANDEYRWDGPFCSTDE